MTEFEKSQLAATLTDIWLRHHTEILSANARASGEVVNRNELMNLDAVLNQFHVVRSWVSTYVK